MVLHSRDDAAEPVISTAGLTKRYGSVVALDAHDLRVHRGEVYGFLGPNGAGKTTTIRLLLGLHRSSGGRATVFGLDAFRRPAEVHRRLAYVPGESSLWPSLTAAETFQLLAGLGPAVDACYRAQARVPSTPLGAGASLPPAGGRDARVDRTVRLCRTAAAVRPTGSPHSWLRSPHQ